MIRTSLKVGSTGLPFRRAQKRMSLVGYDMGSVDGRYPPPRKALSRSSSSSADSRLTESSVRKHGQSSTHWRTKDR
jgi:hypothetical protein